MSHLRVAGLGALADLDFLGLYDDPDDQANRGARRRTRPGRARLRPSQLTKPRTDPARATSLLRALFGLTNLEGAR